MGEHFDRLEPQRVDGFDSARPDGGTGDGRDAGDDDGNAPHARSHSVRTTPATGPSWSIQKSWSIESERRGVRHHHCRSAASHTPASALPRRARWRSSVARARYSRPEARTSWIAMRPSYER